MVSFDSRRDSPRALRALAQERLCANVVVSYGATETGVCVWHDSPDALRTTVVVAQPDPPRLVARMSDAERPARILPVIIISQFAGTSLWFAGNAILPEQHGGVPYEQAANRLGSWSGLMAQAGHAAPADAFVHGDVKPENFLLGQPGTPVIVTSPRIITCTMVSAVMSQSTRCSWQPSTPSCMNSRHCLGPICWRLHTSRRVCSSSTMCFAI